MKYYIILLASVIIFLAVSCAASLPEPTQSDADKAAQRWPGTDIGFLHESRKLYIQKCSGCHKLHNPKEHTESEWDSILVKMSKKAKLNKQQYEDITRFLTVMSGQMQTASTK